MMMLRRLRVNKVRQCDDDEDGDDVVDNDNLDDDYCMLYWQLYIVTVDIGVVVADVVVDVVRYDRYVKEPLLHVVVVDDGDVYEIDLLVLLLMFLL